MSIAVMLKLVDVAFDDSLKWMVRVVGNRNLTIYVRSTSGWNVEYSCYINRTLTPTKVTWAPSSFGQIFALGLTNGSVTIWQRTTFEHRNKDDPCRYWTQRSTIVPNHKHSVVDIKFSPDIFGLLIAICSVNGGITFLKASNLEKLSLWEMKSLMASQLRINCLEFSTRLHCPKNTLLAVGCGHNNGSTKGRLMLWKFKENTTCSSWTTIIRHSGCFTNPINDIASHPSFKNHILAIATNSVRLIKIELIDEATCKLITVAVMDDHHAEVWRVAFSFNCNLIGSSGADGKIRIWKKTENKWNVSNVLKRFAKYKVLYQQQTDEDVLHNIHNLSRFCEMGKLFHPRESKLFVLTD